MTQEKIYSSYILTCSVVSLGLLLLLLLFFLSSVTVANFISTVKSNQGFVFFFFSITFLIAIIPLNLYVGLLQFCGVFLFFSSFFPSLFN